MKARLFKAALKRARGTSVRRKVWRELAVPGRADLYRLGKGIVEAFGLFFDHPFGFYDDLRDPTAPPGSTSSSWIWTRRRPMRPARPLS